MSLSAHSPHPHLNPRPYPYPPPPPEQVSTTLLGVCVTPALAKLLLGGVVAVDAAAVLRSTASIVLLPLLAGVAAGRVCPAAAARVAPACPALGILATLLLVTGGAANSSAALCGGAAAWRLHAGALLLPGLAGAVALCLSRVSGVGERAARTVTIETMVKSPTLAYVLASKHFGPGVAAAPAASMVWLAAVGAGVAIAWRRLVPLEDVEPS